MMLYNRKEGSLLLPSWRFNIVTTDFCRYPYSFGYYLFLLISCGQNVFVSCICFDIIHISLCIFRYANWSISGN